MRASRIALGIVGSDHARFKCAELFQCAMRRIGSVGMPLIMLVLCAVELPQRGYCQDPVREGRQSLRESGSYPWYDRDSDSLRQVVLPSDAEARSDNRDSSWVASDRSQSKSGASNRPTPSMSGLNSFVMILFWIMVGIFFLVLITALVWALLRQRAPADDESMGDLLADDRTDEERIEQLPFEVNAPRADLLSQARQCFEAGDRHRAIVLLFSYMLVRLDREQWIRLAKGKTNRQYLSEIGDHKTLGDLVERVMVAFEDVFFGHLELTSSEFDRCWEQVDHFHQLVGSHRS